MSIFAWTCLVRNILVDKHCIVESVYHSEAAKLTCGLLYMCHVFPAHVIEKETKNTSQSYRINPYPCPSDIRQLPHMYEMTCHLNALHWTCLFILREVCVTYTLTALYVHHSFIRYIWNVTHHLKASTKMYLVICWRIFENNITVCGVPCVLTAWHRQVQGYSNVVIQFWVCVGIFMISLFFARKYLHNGCLRMHRHSCKSTCLVDWHMWHHSCKDYLHIRQYLENRNWSSCISVT